MERSWFISNSSLGTRRGCCYPEQPSSCGSVAFLASGGSACRQGRHQCPHLFSLLWHQEQQTHLSCPLNPAFSPVPLAGTTWLKLCSVSHPKLSERKGKIPGDLSKICRAHSQGDGCNKRSWRGKRKKQFAQQSIKGKYSFAPLIDSTPSPEVSYHYLNHFILLIHQGQVGSGWVSRELQIYYWDIFCEDK